VIRRGGFVALVAVLLAGAVPALAATPTTVSSSSRQAQISKQVSSLKTQISEVSAEEAALLAQYDLIVAQRKALDVKVSALDMQVAAAQGRLDTANDALAKVDGQVAAAEAQLTEANTALSASLRSLNTRAIAAYVDQPEFHLLDALLKARTFRDVDAAKGYLDTLIETEADTVDAVKIAKAERQTAREALNDTRKQAADARDVVAQQVDAVKSARQAQDAVRQEVAAQEAKRLALVNQAKSRKAAFQKQVNALQAESNSISSLLRGVQKGQPIAPSGHGILAIPIPGAPITSTFGMRFDPILETNSMHTGVDFGAAMGTPIHAAADGVVVFAGVRGGYGNCTIIDHGNSLATLYGHQSVIGVSVGQKVKKGQVIGKVGSTGMSTGPHLHFEVRVNGNPVNPLLYL
jgi:murein DD-endopeptidase MepM/ murein hydrolase activator NlpD